ncbi:MAG: tetratricopeptide repeat protein [Bacteroidales bacterium]|nr:tetratricopeptide repeat protein [Bacteroidales bacterium]
MNNKKLKIFSVIAFLVVMIVMNWGCSTRKNTLTRRAFHNLTAHYNALFNGHQALKQGVEQIQDAHVDNFDRVLPVFRLADETASQSAAPQMDRAVKKAAKVVQKHSMEFSGKEYNKWIDDAYLLMGKAHFYKREYLLSKRLFNYVISKYHSHDKVNNAMVWKARVDVIRGNHEQALNSLDQVRFYDSRGDVSKKVRRLYTRVYAQLYIDTDYYDKAVQWLDKAIEANKDKDIVTRLMFIKAQIHQKNGNYWKATNAFRKVINKNPSYELTFYSKINIAEAYQGNQDEDYDIKSELHDLLKDSKNKEYKDVIYYALAQIAMKEGDMKQRIEYLRKSVSKSLNNNRQKAVSSLELGELFFDQKKYELAQNYYDSAMTFLPKQYPAYDSLKAKHNVLSNLVDNLMKVQRQDSLQRIASMPVAERNRFIDELIAEVKEEESRKRMEEQRRVNAMRESQMNNARRSMGGGSGEWYFYNNQAKSFGFTEFKKQWGERNLEDNWRLSDKTTVSFGNGSGYETDEMIIDSLEGGELTNKDKAYYLQDLPLTDSAKAISDSIIMNALFNLGLIYQEDLRDYEKAVESHENLIDKDPKSKYTLRTYYHLYQNYNKLEDTVKANEYKKLILNNYPESDYAKIIKDPDYFQDQAKNMNEAEKFYSEAWNVYEQGSYSRVVTLADTGMSRYGESEIASRLALLKAFANGKMSDSTAYVKALKYVVNNYKNSESAEKASNILQALTPDNSGSSKLKQKGDGSANKEFYTYKPETMQLYIAVFSVKGLSVNDLKAAYSDFNNEYHGLKDLSVNSVYLDNTRQMLTVSRFSDAEEGLKYYRSIKVNNAFDPFFKNNNGKHFIISVNDYSRFYKRKNVEEYIRFFEKNYLSN